MSASSIAVCGAATEVFVQTMHEEDDVARRTVDDFLAVHAAAYDQLLPLLHRVMDACGHVSEAAIGLIADALNLSRAEVHGVVSFYDDFGNEPSLPCIDLCGGEACQAVGGVALYDEARAAAAQKQVRVRRVFCLGNCAAGPSARVGDQIIGRATIARLFRG